MSYCDLVTGEIYGHVIYDGDDALVFWTDGRESQLVGATFGDQVLVVDDDGGRHQVDRFQLVEAHAEHLVAAGRRLQLQDYAAANGEQITEHRSTAVTPEPPPASFLKRLFTPT